MKRKKKKKQSPRLCPSSAAYIKRGQDNDQVMASKVIHHQRQRLFCGDIWDSWNDSETGFSETSDVLWDQLACFVNIKDNLHIAINQFKFLGEHQRWFAVFDGRASTRCKFFFKDIYKKTNGHFFLKHQRHDSPQ